MHISSFHHISFDAATEAAAAFEFEKQHPDWTKMVTDTKTIFFHYLLTQTYEIVPEDKIPTYDTELLMPGIYIKEVK